MVTASLGTFAAFPHLGLAFIGLFVRHNLNVTLNCGRLTTILIDLMVSCRDNQPIIFLPKSTILFVCVSLRFLIWISILDKYVKFRIGQNGTQLTQTPYKIPFRQIILAKDSDSALNQDKRDHL